MDASASIFSDFWQHQLVEHDRQALFLVLVGFLGSFAFIRMSTRLMRSPRVPWWPGSVVSEGGVHVHHLAFGICLMLAAGTVAFAVAGASPWLEICAVVFGIGGGLTIDEFALFIYLDDVYWSREGRSSVDATVIAATAMLLVLVGARPFEVSTASALDLIGTATTAAIVFGCVAICFAKQRTMHGALGFFVWVLAAYGAIRIGKPGSPWAKRFYGERRPDKQAKAERRFRPERRTERIKERLRDAIGGVTEEIHEARLAEREGRDEAVAEIRERAERVAATEGHRRTGPPGDR